MSKRYCRSSNSAVSDKVGVQVVLDLAHCPVDTWESHDHVVAQSIDRVVCVGQVDGFDEKVCPARELRRK
jgi:hypothetical protein